MYPSEFQKRLQAEFDRRVELKRDRSDNCWVVWDRTRSGVPYQAYKVACEHDNPAQKGTPRDPYDRDLHALRRMNWAEKYRGRKGAREELMRKFYLDPLEQQRLDMEWRVEETIREKVRPLALWQSGARNSISMRPGEKHAGGMKNRYHDRKRRIKARLGLT